MPEFKTDDWDRIRAGLDKQDRKGKLVDIITFAEDPYYFGKRLNKNRFKHQRIILKCFYGLPLSPNEKEWVNQIKRQGRTNWEPKKKYRTLILEVGQRSGKSFNLGIITGYEAHCWIESENPWTQIPEQNGCAESLAPDSWVEIKMVATSRENARDRPFAEFKAFLDNSPYFQDRCNIDKDVNTLEIKFPKNLMVRAGSSTAKAIRGGTGLMCGMDEMDWMTNTDTSIGGQEIYRAMENTLASLKGRMVIITSPSTVDAMGWRLYKLAMAGEVNDTLAWNLNSFEFDPTNRPTDEFFVGKMKSDPESYNRDFMAHPSQALEPYFAMHGWIDDLFYSPVPGGLKVAPEFASIDVEREFHRNVLRVVLDDSYPVIRGVRYVLSGDPAERNDAFGYCLSHQTEDKKHIDVDLIGRFLPVTGLGGEIDTTEVSTVLVALCKKFRPVYVSDIWGFQELRQRIKNTGIKIKEVQATIERCNTAKEGIYCPGPWDKSVSAKYDGRLVRCWYWSQLEKELKGLEVENGKKVEYPRKEGEIGHGDVAVAFMHNIAEQYDPNASRGTIRSFKLPGEGEGGIERRQPVWMSRLGLKK